MQDLGHIVTMASLAGLNGTDRLVDYCSSKFAAVGFDESLRTELAVSLIPFPLVSFTLIIFRIYIALMVGKCIPHRCMDVKESKRRYNVLSCY